MCILCVPGGGDGGKVAAHGLDDPPAPDPEAKADAHSSIEQQPDGGRVVGQHRAAVVHQPERHQGTNCIAAGATEARLLI